MRLRKLNGKRPNHTREECAWSKWLCRGDSVPLPAGHPDLGVRFGSIHCRIPARPGHPFEAGMKFLYFIVLWLAIATVYTVRSPYRKLIELAAGGLPMTAEVFEKTDPPHAKARYHYRVAGKVYTGEDDIRNEAERVAADYPMRGVYLPADPSFSSVRVESLKEAARSERNDVILFDLLAAPATAALVVFFIAWMEGLFRDRNEPGSATGNRTRV